MRWRARLLWLCVMALTLFPVFYILINSLMPPGTVMEAYGGSPLRFLLWPSPWSGVQYATVFSQRELFWRPFLISVGLSVAGTVLHLLVAPVAAFFFATRRSRGANALFFVFIIVMMAPAQVTLLPNFLFAKLTGLHGTYGSLLLPAMLAPFGVFLLRQMMAAVPKEILEAGALETSNPMVLLWRIVCPYIGPGLLTLGILQFPESWGMVEQPMIMLRSPLQYPLSMALESIMQYHAGIAFACSVLSLLPMLGLFAWMKGGLPAMHMTSLAPASNPSR